MTGEKPLRLEDLPDLVRVGEYAEWARRSINQAYDDVREGRVNSIKLGRRILIPRRALEKLAGKE